MNRRALISLFLAFAMLILLPAGSFSASAEGYIPEILPAPAEDGHLIDGDTLTAFFDNYLKENYCDNENQLLSIALWYPGTDEYWFYNADEWMYGVNWYRLPVSMYLTEKVANGELSMDTSVNGITLEYAVTTALEASSNPSASSMVIYLGGDMTTNCADLTRGLTDLPESYFTSEYYQENGYTARLMLEITKTLYLGGEERFPLVEESMKKSMPEDFFKRDWDLRHEWEIAQVHSAYWGQGAGDRINCTGIIYTPTPILVTVMMKNIADLDILGGVAWRAAHLAVALNERQQAESGSAAGTAVSAEPASAASADPAVLTGQAAEPAAAESTQNPEISAVDPPADNSTGVTAPAEQAEQAEQIPTPAPETPAPAAETPAPTAEAPAASATPAPQAGTAARRSRPPIVLFIIIFAIMFIAVVSYAIVLIVREQREQKHRRRHSRR